MAFKASLARGLNLPGHPYQLSIGQSNWLQKIAAEVVTGVFCNTAIESAQSDKDIAIMKQMRKHDAQVQAHARHASVASM